jgi:hypothetical protein
MESLNMLSRIILICGLLLPCSVMANCYESCAKWENSICTVKQKSKIDAVPVEFNYLKISPASDGQYYVTAIFPEIFDGKKIHSANLESNTEPDIGINLAMVKQEGNNQLVGMVLTKKYLLGEYCITLSYADAQNPGQLIISGAFMKLNKSLKDAP